MVESRAVYRSTTTTLLDAACGYISAKACPEIEPASALSRLTLLAGCLLLLRSRRLFGAGET